jgi:hypothetical protein
MEDPEINLKYLGRVYLTNSLLAEGDMLRTEGVTTEMKSMPPPIQATIAVMWKTRRTRNTTSTVSCRPRFGVKALIIYGVRLSSDKCDS